MNPNEQAARIRAAWDQRARENARHYIATLQPEWTDEAFFASGEATVEGHILTDIQNVCQGKNPRDMRVLEIGCGTGRITRALANRFGEVHAVDISGEMIARARESLRAHPNAHVYQNNGMDLSPVPADQPFDFAFSLYVFQHIPSYEIIESYISEVSRLLRPGALFKFQAQGSPLVESTPRKLG
jgi:ubiquinone/menaquinone biosynthesis C-methylase UbiE